MGSIKYIEWSIDQAYMMAKLSLIIVVALLPYVCQSTFTLHRKPQSCADGNCKDANRLEKRQLLEQILKEIEEKEASIEQRRVQQQQVDEQQREQIQQQLDQQQLNQQQLQNIQHQLEVQKHRQVQQQQLAELYQHLEHQQELFDQQEELRHQQQQLDKRLDELQRRRVTQKVNSLTDKVFEVLLDCKESECESLVEDFEHKRTPISSLLEEFALDVVKEVNNAKAAEGKTFF